MAVILNKSESKQISPIELLLDEANNFHKKFLDTMAPLVGISRQIDTIKISFPEKLPFAGRFNYQITPSEIYLSRNHTNYLDFLFTVAHESAHYLHYFNSPNFFHTVYLENGKPTSKPGYWDYGEFVANALAMDFFRMEGRLHDFFNDMKKTICPSRPLQSARAQDLVEYVLYRSLFLQGSFYGSVLSNNVDEVSARLNNIRNSFRRRDSNSPAFSSGFEVLNWERQVYRRMQRTHFPREFRLAP